MTNSTLEYYEKNAEQLIQDTLNKNMSTSYEVFERYLHKSAHILDAGCGSGRDSLYFKNRGYQCTAFDISSKMCAFASDLLGQEVRSLVDKVQEAGNYSIKWENDYFDIRDRMVRRIFNDGSFLNGGRLYAFWQNIPKKIRKLRKHAFLILKLRQKRGRNPQIKLKY